MQKKELCLNLEVNHKHCSCSYSACDKKGRCCECIRFHRERNELPGCLFSSEVERTYDRTVEKFVASRG